MVPDPATIPALMALRRRVDADLEALVGDEGAISYSELDEASRSRAAQLVAAGMGTGDRVGLLQPNGIDWAVTAFAVMRVGAVLVPLSTLLRPPELLAQLNTASVTHLITVEGYRDRSYVDDLDAAATGLASASQRGARHPAAPSLRRLWSADDLPEVLAPDDVVRALEEGIRPAHDLAVLFTSGSRGAPKAVIHTHGGALRATAAGLEARGVRPGERLYIPMPFFWMGGFGGGLLTVLVAGATLVTEADPEPGRTLDLLVRERVTLFRGWPDQAARIAAHRGFARTDLSSLRDGSLPALLPPERRPAAGARANLFGMTESFGPYAGYRLDRDLPADKFGSCGRPFDGIEVRIADPESGGPLPADGTGEIWLRGPNMLRGICGRLRASVFTADGFYRTGDLGRLDDDGFLWFVGRLDDMVKVKGATVYPSEVESALRSIRSVRHAHVTDLAGDDDQRQVGALVVTDASLDSVVAELRDRLSAFKVPTRWFVTEHHDAVPMSATGKVDKASLQQLLRDRGIAGRPRRGRRARDTSAGQVIRGTER